MATTATTTAPSFWTGVESFFSNVGTDIGNIAQNISNDLTWLDKEASDLEQFIVAQAPVLYSSVQGLLTAAQAATTAIAPSLESIIAAGQAILTDIETIFEKTGTAGPGGSATP